MATLEVAGRSFRNESEYSAACRDVERFELVKSRYDLTKSENVKVVLDNIEQGKIRFATILGQDFIEELKELCEELEQREQNPSKQKKGLWWKHKATDKLDNSKTNRKEKINSKARLESKSLQTSSHKMNSDGNISSQNKSQDKSLLDDKNEKAIELEVRRLLVRKQKKHILIMALCVVVAVGSMGYFLYYNHSASKNETDYAELATLKEKPPVIEDVEVVVHRTDDIIEVPDILDEYKNLYIKNKSIIGWLKIDDTNIDYPVMQTTNNEYYLNHNFDGEEDKNGCLFLDADCDVIKGNTNLIVYGHHMKSGKMFGNLNKYSKMSFYEKHPFIQFDTIYEKGTYQVMYVFQDHVKDAADVSFKYYEFIDALSEQEFRSNMIEMQKMSIYSTGVTATFGDKLLTLSTCDSSTTNGRFVVVAKRIY